jgi:hypothetical protein
MGKHKCLINGKVLDESGLPIPDSILIKGSSNATTTDFDGNYQIRLLPAVL